MRRTREHNTSLPALGLILFGLLVAYMASGCGGAESFDHPWDRPHQSNEGLDWRDQVIYQIVVDRFENGDSNNDFNVEPSVAARYQYPNRNMYQEDEKSQQNRFLADWLEHCLQNGHVSHPLAVPGSGA